MRSAALVAVVALLITPAFAGCLEKPRLVADANAPREGGGLTLFVASVSLKPSGQAGFIIKKDGVPIYPPGGVAKGAIAVSNGHGSIFVPYAVFVVGNGLYDISVDYDGQTSHLSVPIVKWVEYVYMHPVVRGSNVQLDLQLSKAQGGLPTDRVIAEGELMLAIHYRGLDGKSKESVPTKVVRTKTPEDETYMQISVPKRDFDRGPGYYSFEATFNNLQASGNNNVGNDPTMAGRSPPWNWVCIDTCA